MMYFKQIKIAISIGNSIWRAIGLFSFSLLMTLIVYALTVNSLPERKVSEHQKAQISQVQYVSSVQAQSKTDRVLSNLVRSESLTDSTPIIAANASTQVQKVAQVSSIALQQGQEISLNGNRFSVAWTQWQQGDAIRTGISDTGAMQSLGIELLNTTKSDVQPVLWFPTAPNRPIALRARFISPYRYIDVTDLISQAGASITVSGNVLSIDFPPAQILNVRQGNQTWGKRLVIDLDRPVFWQVSQAPKQGAVIIEGMATSQLLAQFQRHNTSAEVRQTDEDDLGSGDPSSTFKKSGDRVFSLESDGQVTKLLLDLPTAYGVQVSSLANPNRLAIDIRPDAMKQRDIAWMQGIIWRQRFVNLNRDSFPVNLLEIDPRSPGISLKPITSAPNTLAGTAPLVTTARTWQATAAINGGFFNRDNQLPLGAIRLDNRWLSSPILNRGAIAWNDKGQVKIGRLTLQEVLTTSTGNRLPVLFLNSGYVQAGLARYTPSWGLNYTPLSDSETIIVVQNNRVTQQIKAGKAGNDSFAIPADGYLLAIRKSGSPASALLDGTQVNLENATVPPDFANYPYVLGAGPLLIQNNRIVLNAASEQFSQGFQQQMASRSAIAVTNRGTIIITAIHNRVGGRGATLSELAQIMQKLGAVDALNLDGGSSTSLSLGGQLLDRSPVTAAKVHNGIGIFVSSSP